MLKMVKEFVDVRFEGFEIFLSDEDYVYNTIMSGPTGSIKMSATRCDVSEGLGFVVRESGLKIIWCGI